MSKSAKADEARLDWALREVTGAETPPDLVANVLARRARGDAALLPDVDVASEAPRSSRWLAAAIVLIGVGAVAGVAWAVRDAKSTVAPVQQPVQEPAPVHVYSKHDIEALPDTVRSIVAHGLDDDAVRALLMTALHPGTNQLPAMPPGRFAELRELELRYDHAMVTGLGLKTTPPEHPVCITTKSFEVFAQLTKLRALRIRGAWGVTEDLALQDTSRRNPAIDLLARLPMLEELAFTHFDVPSNYLALLGQLRGLQALDLTANYGVDEHAVDGLLRCTELRSLKLASCMLLPGASIAKLAALPKLEELDVGDIDGINWRSAPGDFLGPNAKAFEEAAHEAGKASGLGVTDDALRGLAKAPRLKVLDIAQARASLAGLQTLADCAQLETLNLFGIASTGAGGGESVADAIAACLPPSLQKLQACGDYTDAFCRRLRERLPKLRVLELPACYRITDDGVAELVRIASLRHLDLNQSRGLTVAVLASLRTATQLESLDLRNMDWVTAAIVCDLRAALPNLQELSSSVPDEELARERQARQARDQEYVVEHGKVDQLPPDARRVRGRDWNSDDLRQALARCPQIESLDLTTSYSRQLLDPRRTQFYFPGGEWPSLVDGDLGTCAQWPNLRRLILCGNFALTGKSIPELLRLASLEELDLSLCVLDPGNLRVVTRLPNLQRLTLDQTLGYDAADLTELSHCGKLQALSLRGSPLSETTAWDAIGRLSRIQELRVGVGRTIGRFLVRDERAVQLFSAMADGWQRGARRNPVLRSLGAMQSLQKLDLGNTDIDVPDLTILDKLAALTEFATSSPELSADVIDHLPPPLRLAVFIGCPQLDDAFAKRLAARCPRLESLDVSDTAIGDDGVNALLGLANLRTFTLANTRATAAVIPALRQHARFAHLDIAGLPWALAAEHDLRANCDELRTSR